MLYIHRSNQQERLLERLTEVVSVPQAGVMTPESIIVQSQGMARWLSLQLADRLGISANLDCAFPAAFIWRLLRRNIPANQINSLAAYEPESMLWLIMELLDSRKNKPDFEEVAGYLRDDADGLRRFQLAARLAALFDKYMVYRPDWFRQWPVELENWQADLWRSIAELFGEWHRAALQDQLLQGLARYSSARQTGQGGELPPGIENIQRLSIFGIPALPPSQFAVFAGLANLFDVHIFLLSPCREFWTDLVSARTLTQARLASGGLDPEADLHLEEGCPLLTSMGALGREFQILLQDSGAEYLEDDLFVEPQPGSALALLQNDILNSGGVVDEPLTLPADDQSITIQITHSPMREVEILHNQLLEWLTDDRIEPADILVMTPDINLYAPLIDAVFSNSDTDIPFTIADGPLSGALIRGFLELLKLDERAGASEIMALLRYEPLRARFAIAAEQLAVIEGWIRESGIKWGLAAADERPRPGSWLAGLERLLMGYIYGGEGLAQVTGRDSADILVDEILPCDILEGGDGDLLAGLLDLITALRRLLAYPSSSLAAWSDFFNQALDDFFVIDDDNLRQAQFIRQQFAALKRAAESSGSTARISAAVIRSHLQNILAASQGGSFLCGRVTFCQMAPMRSIPFPIICVLGMNHDAFPRQERPLSFDLSAQSRRPGDRSRRADDRYLFMETIISARRCLYMSYIGLSVQNNAVMPPSVLIDELLDYLGRRLELSAAETARRFTCQHPLQPFSRRYFSGKLYSYCRRSREIAGQIGQNRPWEGLFDETCTARKMPPIPKDEGRRTVSLADFMDFFKHPVRFLLRQRFGVNLDDYYEELDDREPFSMDYLTRYQIIGGIMEGMNDGRPTTDILTASQQRGRLPEGEAGEFYFAASQEMAARLHKELRYFTEAAPVPIDNIQLNLGDFTLTGSLEASEAGQYHHRPVAVKSMKYMDYAQCRIYQLLLGVLRPDLQLTTTFVGLDGSKTWQPLAADTAMDNLRQLSRAFDYGQNRPLPIYPQSTLAYAKARFTGRKRLAPEAALEKARYVWSTSSRFNTAENSDPYFTAAFGRRQLPEMPETEFNFAALAELLLTEQEG